MSVQSTLVVTEIDPAQDLLQKTAFGELSVAELTPIAQIVGSRGLLTKVAQFALNGGTTAENDGLFESGTGAEPDGVGSVVTARQATYRAGQGLLARVTAVFDTPQPDSIQHTGLITINDRFCFGYEGTQFGLVHVHHGTLEIQELTITTGAAGAESATVTVDGTPYTVPLTAGTPAHNAFEVAESLNAQGTGYVFTANGPDVVARAILPTYGGGLFAFGSATAVGAWVQLEVANVPVTDFVPQALWNVNTVPWLIPQLGNVYQVQMQFLGFGVIRFYVEDPDDGKELLVHIIKYPNTSSRPSVGDPTFRAGWLAINQGNTLPVTLRGSSAALFTEGRAVPDEPSRADNNINLSVGSAVYHNVITLRNRQVFRDRQNRYDVVGLSLTVTSNSSKSTFIRANVNAVLAGEPVYSYIDKESSLVEVSKDDVEITGGRLAASGVVQSGGSFQLELPLIGALLSAGNTVSISARVDSGAVSEVAVTVVWQEDL
jgi:hypothetical protein